MKRVVTAIELNDVDIKLFQAEKVRGKDTVTFYDIRPIIHHSDEDAAALLKKMIALLPIVPDKPILLVPRRFAILRQMRLPSYDPKEIEDMIGLQLVNNIPYSITDVIYRYHLLDQNSEGYSRALVIILYGEIIQRYQQILQSAGIRNAKLTLNSFGVRDWLVYQSNKHQAVAVLNLDSQYSEICFCYDKKLFFSRSLSFKGKRLLLDDTEELVKQIGLSLDIYHSEHLGPETKDILIVSAPSEGKGLKRHIEDKLKLAAQIIEPFNNICCSHNSGRTDHQEHYPFSITAALGILMPGTKDFIDLAPAKIHAEKYMGIRQRWMVQCVLLFLMAAILGATVQLVHVEKRKTRLELLKNEVERLQAQAEKSREKIQFVEFFDQKLARVRFIPDLINEFNHLTPEGVSFRALSLDENGELMIQGYARMHAGMNDLQARLIQSSLFHDVDLKFATKRKIAGISVMDFKIVLQLYNEREETSWPDL